ncbi:MAG: CHAT domain-containing tetratricopeptide repeat protein, partial [Thermoanaerobaculia bacterium]
IAIRRKFQLDADDSDAEVGQIRKGELAVSLLAMASVFKQQERYEEAERNYLEVSGLHGGFVSTIEWARHLNNWGDLYRRMARYDSAEEKFRDAIRIRDSLWSGPQDPEYADCLNNLGLTLALQEDRRADARPLFEEAIRILERHPTARRSFNAVFVNYGALLCAEGELQSAFKYYIRALELSERDIERMFPFQAERERMALVGELWMDLEHVLSILPMLPSKGPEVDRAYAAVLRWKGIGLGAVRKLRALQGANDQGEAWPLSNERPKATEHQTDAQRRFDHEASERSAAAKARQKLVPDAQHPEDVLARLEPDSVFIDYVKYRKLDSGPVDELRKSIWNGFHKFPDRYGAFLCSKDGIAYKELFPGRRIDMRIEWLSEQVETVGHNELPISLWFECCHELFAALVEPLLTGAPKVSRLIIAPDGELSRLPFEMLLTSDDKYLIDEYVISHVIAGRDLCRAAGAVTNCSDPVVFGDPWFGDGRLSGSSEGNRGKAERWEASIRRLPATRIEAIQVGACLGVQATLGEDATAERFLKAVRPIVLHVATHGHYLRRREEPPRWSSLHWEHPLMRTGLVLAGGLGRENDVGGSESWLGYSRIVSAYEISGMDLEGTALVFLSACETGLGDIFAGEGTFGLRRALAIAGAETVIATLWRVDDELSSHLVEKFYGYLVNGFGRAESLRRAQMDVRSARSHPMYWAGFVCEGVSGPIDKELRRGEIAGTQAANPSTVLDSHRSIEDEVPKEGREGSRFSRAVEAARVVVRSIDPMATVGLTPRGDGFVIMVKVATQETADQIPLVIESVAVETTVGNEGASIVMP